MIISKQSKTRLEILRDLLNHTTEVKGCKEWKGCLNTDGYPRMMRKGDSNIKVHRWVAELFFKKDITGLVVRHKCDNIRCINPSHLELGSNADNMQDRLERGGYNTKYSKSLVDRVESLLKSNLLTQAEIAKLVGIAPQRVSEVKNGKLLRKSA